MEFISNSIASRQLAELAVVETSLYVVGLPKSIKKRSGKYLLGGYNSFSDQRGKTRLAGLDTVVLGTSIF